MAARRPSAVGERSPVKVPLQTRIHSLWPCEAKDGSTYCLDVAKLPPLSSRYRAHARPECLPALSMTSRRPSRDSASSPTRISGELGRAILIQKNLREAKSA